MCLQEAKQALELMGRWEMIDVSDALELLSPVFESEEVGACKIRQIFNAYLHSSVGRIIFPVSSRFWGFFLNI